MTCPLFDTSKDFAYHKHPKTNTMSDLGYPKHTALSKAAVSNPFKLFTSEAVHLMRQEAFSRVVKEHYTFSNVPGQKHIRGYVPK